MTMLIIRTLEELDGAEARLVLLDLPPMDVDRVSRLSSRPSLEVQATKCLRAVCGLNGKTSASAIHYRRCHYSAKAKAIPYDATYR